MLVRLAREQIDLELARQGAVDGHVVNPAQGGVEILEHQGVGADLGLGLIAVDDEALRLGLAPSGLRRAGGGGKQQGRQQASQATRQPTPNLHVVS